MERLQKEHQKEISKSKDRIRKWEQYRKDYQSVQERLRSLPERLQHDVMVPLGRLAYMPGHIYHTNEILVLLGDNWFAKRTARQAMGVAERRRLYVLKQLEIEKQNLSDLEARVLFTTDQHTEDTVDIVEQCDPKLEKGQKVRKARKPAEMSDREVWARLEKLEKEEEEYLRAEKEDSSEEDLCLPINIPIQHTKVDNSGNEKDMFEEKRASACFMTPADIFTKLGQYPKHGIEDDSQSVLVEKHVSWDPELPRSVVPEQSISAPMPAAAAQPLAHPFSGRVVERSPLSPAVVTPQQGTQRKVSKFKSTRPH